MILSLMVPGASPFFFALKEASSNSCDTSLPFLNSNKGISAFATRFDVETFFSNSNTLRVAARLVTSLGEGER